MPEPLSTVGDGQSGRDERGRFADGNRAGRGNPHSRRVAELRSALLAAVTPRDVKQVVSVLLEKAKGGDTVAAAQLLDRTIGKPTTTDILQRLEALEQALGVEI